MAEAKKSFILYADLLHTVDKLPDDIAGKLLKTILKYVNDLNPVVDDLILQVAFEPIKQQLKRDLSDWRKTKKKRSESGKKGMASRWNKDEKNITNDNGVINPITNITVNENDTVNVNDTVTVTVIERDNMAPDLSKSNLYRQPVIPTIEQVEQFFTGAGGTKEQAEKFFAKHNAVNWFLNGSPIINFSNLVPTFISNWNKNLKNATNNGHSSSGQKRNSKSAGAYELAEELKADLGGAFDRRE